MLRWIIAMSLWALLILNSMEHEYLSDKYHPDMTSFPESAEKVNGRLTKPSNVNSQDYSFRNKITNELQQLKDYLSNSDPDDLEVNELKEIRRVLLYILDTNVEILKTLHSKDNDLSSKFTPKEINLVKDSRRSNKVSNTHRVPSSIDMNTNLRLLVNNYHGRFLRMLRQYLNHGFNQAPRLGNIKLSSREENSRKENWTNSSKRVQRTYWPLMSSLSNVPTIPSISSLPIIPPASYIPSGEIVSARNIIETIPPGLLPKKMPKVPYSVSYNDGKTNWNINLNPGNKRRSWQKSIKDSEADITENDVRNYT